MGRVKELLLEMQERENWPSGLEDKYVCASHFTDKYLREWINSSAKDGVCSYCGCKCQVANMQDFGEHVAFKINSQYNDVNDANLYYADGFYDEDGRIVHGLKDFCGYAVPREAECFESTRELLEYLDFYVDDDNLQEDVESIFKTQKWVSRDILSTEEMGVLMSDMWDKFSDMVKHQRRFTFLADHRFIRILTKPKEMGPKEDSNILSVLKSLINQVGLIAFMNTDDVFYRVRKLDELGDKYGFNDITSPSDDKAFNNRMSPAGISMFYASFNKEIAKNEASGDDQKGILIGKFRPKRRLRLVDLTAIPNDLSFWMNYYQENKFLNKFIKEVTKPIGSKDKDIEYVPTQIFTEYIRYMFKDYKGRGIDGIIYSSSKSSKEKNLVLFCNQEESKEFVDLAGPIELYTKKWIKVDEWS